MLSITQVKGMNTRDLVSMLFLFGAFVGARVFRKVPWAQACFSSATVVGS